MPDVDGFMLARRVRREKRLAKTPIVMLTSVGQSGRRAAASEEWHRRVPDQAGQAFRSARRARPGCLRVATKHGRTEPLTERIGSRPGVPLHVLVAEDNPVNRKLVTTLLRKRGHKVKAVENGREAVEAIQAATGQAVRRRVDGSSDAGDERFRGDAGDRDRESEGGQRAAHRADRSRDARRSRTLPRGRHGRLSVEADRRRRADCNGREVRRGEPHRRLSGRPAASQRTPSSSTSAQRWHTREAIAGS